MKVTVVGVTGRVGKRVTRLLVEGGHEVLGVNRRPERVQVALPDLDVPTVAASTDDFHALMSAFGGAEVVVLATAPTREDPRVYLTQTENVLRAAKLSRVGRLVVLSNHMALKAPDGRPMLEATPPHPYFREVEAVYTDQAALIRAEAELDWVLVAPPAEVYPYGGVTDTYRVGTDTLLVSGEGPFKETSQLSMEDLAVFLVGEAVAPRHHRALVTLAY